VSDEAHGIATDSCFDTLKWIDVQNLNSHVEANGHERHAPCQYRRIPSGPELAKIVAARDTRCETRRVLYERECLGARDRNRNVSRGA
jgi:hypothetical protein